MATSYPLATLAPTIDATGISAPTYNDTYQSLLASFKAIYGSDIYVEPDSQDGQWIAVLAQAIYESNQAAVTCFLAFSPTYSQGTHLSDLVRLNGISRKVATNSTAQGTVVGVAGTSIVAGVVQDADDKLWSLPATVVIPLSGEINVTITAQEKGAISAPIGTITKLYNPQFGWQSFTNTTEATMGAPVELDADLRARQAISVATPALTIVEAISGAVADVTGVTRSFVYENDTGSIDANGIPAHSLSVVALGGNSADIAAAIAKRKTPGAQTYGSTSVIVYDRYGLATQINYFILELVPTYFVVTVKAVQGWAATTPTEIKKAIAAFVNQLKIGEDVYNSQSQAAAGLIGTALGSTFYITDFKMGAAPAPSGSSTIAILFNQAATSDIANISIVVT